MIKCLCPGHLEERAGDGRQDRAIGSEYLHVVAGKVRYPICPGQRVESLECRSLCARIGHGVEEQAGAFSSGEAYESGPGLIGAKVCHHNIAGPERTGRMRYWR